MKQLQELDPALASAAARLLLEKSPDAMTRREAGFVGPDEFEQLPRRQQDAYQRAAALQPSRIVNNAVAAGISMSTKFTSVGMLEAMGPTVEWFVASSVVSAGLHALAYGVLARGKANRAERFRQGAPASDAPSP